MSSDSIRQTWKERKAELKEEQEDKPYEEIKEELERKNKFLLELDNLMPIKHNWIDRGTRMSCENAGHPYHQAFKSKR